MVYRKLQHPVELHWIEWWKIPLSKYMKAKEVRTKYPTSRLPRVQLSIDYHEGTIIRSWAEITAAYASSAEAQFLRQEESRGNPLVNVNPQDNIASWALWSVENLMRNENFSNLVNERGKGHLLVVLDSPFASFSTLERAEHRIVEFLHNNYTEDTPFRFFWLAFHISVFEQPKENRTSFVYAVNARRKNFFKCIFTMFD